MKILQGFSMLQDCFLIVLNDETRWLLKKWCHFQKNISRKELKKNQAICC
jgi:hypothetical protein